MGTNLLDAEDGLLWQSTHLASLGPGFNTHIARLGEGSSFLIKYTINLNIQSPELGA